MRILKDIGEVGIHVQDGRDVILRPSLYAMSQLGTPRQIVEAFYAVAEEPAYESQARLQQITALSVLAACSETDISDIIGGWDGETYAPGVVPAGVVLILARTLLRHGVVGALPPTRARPEDDQPEYVTEFDARAHVATAMAHLGVSENDAWNMTMTGLVGALRSKYPPPESDAPGARAPSVDEYDATMAWLDQIEAARAAQSGSH